MKSCKLFDFFHFFLPFFLGVPDFCVVLFWEDFFRPGQSGGGWQKPTHPNFRIPKTGATVASQGSVAS